MALGWPFSASSTPNRSRFSSWLCPLFLLIGYLLPCPPCKLFIDAGCFIFPCPSFVHGPLRCRFPFFFFHPPARNGFPLWLPVCSFSRILTDEGFPLGALLASSAARMSPSSRTQPRPSYVAFLHRSPLHQLFSFRFGPSHLVVL